jgi:glycosyltransferase involved in cell wall biosynthesis
MPGCREIVRDEHNGILIPPRNATVLANAIERLSADVSLYVQMGINSRKIVVENFSANKVVAAYLNLSQTLAIS